MKTAWLSFFVLFVSSSIFNYLYISCHTLNLNEINKRFFCFCQFPFFISLSSVLQCPAVVHFSPRLPFTISFLHQCQQICASYCSQPQNQCSYPSTSKPLMTHLIDHLASCGYNKLLNIKGTLAFFPVPAIRDNWNVLITATLLIPWKWTPTQTWSGSAHGWLWPILV